MNVIKTILLCFADSAIGWLEEVVDKLQYANYVLWLESIAWVVGSIAAVSVPVLVAVRYIEPSLGGFGLLVLMWFLAYIILELIRRTYKMCKEEFK